MGDWAGSGFGCGRLKSVERIGIVIKLRLLPALVALAMVPGLVSPVSAFATPDVTAWTSHTSPGGNGWSDIAYGNGVYVAVAAGGDGQRVMTSSDGMTWTLHTPLAEDLWWKSVVFGAGIFVAVSNGNDVMTSPDGFTWTRRTPSSRINWWSVTYGGGQFVAVAGSGAGNRVMTSPDGITWTGRAASITAQWTGITFGNGLFVAVGYGDKVMTSPDGITWTTRSAAGLGANWNDITYGNGTFVAVAQNGEVMRSANGTTWIDSAMPGSVLVAVTYGDRHFVALDQNVIDTDRFETTGGVTVVVAKDIVRAQSQQLLTSTDGRVWTNRTTPYDSYWSSVTYGDGRFVAVSSYGYGDRVMRSGVVTVIAPAPDPAAVEAARVAAERAAIAEAARLRQIEIEKYRTALFAKLIRGERPILSEYNNAIFYQITSRTIENVTDQILQLEVSRRSDVATINEIADGAAFYDAFFNPAFPATIGTYSQYGYFGVTVRTLTKVNAQVQVLPLVKRKDGISFQEIIAVEGFIDQLSNLETRKSVSSDRLVKMGLLSPTSIHKVSVINGLRGRSESELDSIEEIKEAIAAQLSVIQLRKDRTAAIKAKIQTRNR